jgi:two-component system, NarL family, sensor kinase
MSQLPLHEIVDPSSLSKHLENTPLALIICDNNDHIIYWSKKATEIFEWEESEVLNRPVSELRIIHDDDVHDVYQIVLAIKSGKISSKQHVNRNCTKSGKVIYCEWYNSASTDASGKVCSVLSMVQDITERQKAKEALEISEQRLSLVYNSAIDPMWLIHIAGRNQFILEGINKSFTQVTGLEKEQVLGFPIEQVMPESSHELVRTKYNQAIQTGEVIDYVEVAMHPAGQKVGEIRVIPVKDSSGNVIKLVCIANDITEKRSLQKQLDAERDDFNNRITAAAVKGQEKERSNVSRELHDNVNQVLTTIKLYIELCISKSIDSKEILPKCANLLNETINEIRDLSKRLSAPSLGDIGLNETLRELCESVEVTKKVRIKLDTTAVECNHIDSDLHLAVYRIAQEQLTNILKHANSKKVLMKLEVNDAMLRLTIRDYGKGFDMSSTRAGIGLTNIRSRAEMLNGSVDISSEIGKGSTVVAEIPVMIEDGKCFPVSKVLT